MYLLLVLWTECTDTTERKFIDRRHDGFNDRRCEQRFLCKRFPHFLVPLRYQIILNVVLMMFCNNSKNNTASNPAKILNSSVYVFGASLPMLQRNVRCRYRKLAHRSAIQEPLCATNETANAVGTKSSTVMVDVAPLKTTPFLKRNLRNPHLSITSSHRKAAVGTIRRIVAKVDSVNTLRRYHVHCITSENNEKMKKNTIMHSFSSPAYQCPFCVSYEGVSATYQMPLNLVSRCLT